MKFFLSERARNLLYAQMQRMLVGGTLEICSGPMPSSPSSPAVSGGTLCVLPIAWDVEAQRAAPENAIVSSAGHPEWARALNANGETLWLAGVGPAGCTIEIDNNFLGAGQVLVLPNFAFFGL
jgi:hypothetical protein